MPFTLSTIHGELHGIIDLLFHDRAGSWQLVEWKTEGFPKDKFEEEARAHRIQIALYAAAARRVLGVAPEARVCFLGRQAQVYAYTAAELETEAAWTDSNV